MQILEVPSLLEEGSSSVVKRNILKQKHESDAKNGSGCCQ
jgi:Ras-related protein Rab-18